VPDDDADESKPVALGCIALRCSVWRYTWFVFHLW